MDKFLILVAAVLGGGLVTAVWSIMKYNRDTLRDAFKDATNDKASRIDAWKEYKKIGGKNFTNYIKELEALDK